MDDNALLVAAALILIVVPILVTGFTVFLAALQGLVWSPFAAMITWRMARWRGLDGRRYALVGALCSVFLLLPWILLTVALLRRHLPVSVVKLSRILAYTVCLIGPIAVLGQSSLSIESLMNPGLGFLGVEDPEPVFPIMTSALPPITYGMFAAMLIAWAVSVMLPWKTWSGHPGVTVEDMATFRYIIPFALTWGCLLLFLVYMFVILRLAGIS